MVRVLSVYHFSDQTVHKIGDELNDSCLIGANKLAIATPNMDVEIWDLGSADNAAAAATSDRSPSSSSSSSSSSSYFFPTVDEVEQIEYCRNGNYLATIESKVDNRDRTLKYVRVYTNWDAIEQRPQHIVNFRARIAGKVTPSDKYLTSNDLEMIELPLKVIPSRIACCQSTGNLALCCDNKVLFYEFRAVGTENGRHEYIDFLEIPFLVELSFRPSAIEFCEGVVCCLDQSVLNLFKIQRVNEQSIISVSVDSFSSEITHSVINTRDTIDFRAIAQHKMLNNELFRVELLSDSDDFGNCDIKPELVNDMLVVLQCLGESDLMNKYSIKSLLQLKTRRKYRSFCDTFRCVSMRPIYRLHESGQNGAESDAENIFQSDHSKTLIAIAMIVATQQDAYLYLFHNNDEWRQQPELLASYSFTSPVIDLVLDEAVLHALTETGIETYTLRTGQKIFYSPCEFMLNLNQEEILRPNADDPICLIGIRPFLSVKRIFNSGTNVVLLANETSAERPAWTAYSLKKPGIDAIYRNIEEFATRFKFDNPRIFLHLMNEAHVMVRLVVEMAKAIPVDELNRQNLKSIPLITFNATVEPQLESVFLTSCHMLGDYFVLQTSEEEYYMALPYYLMGKLNVNEIFNRLIQFERNQDGTMTGIIYTLKRLFLRLQPDTEDPNLGISNHYISSSSKLSSASGGEPSAANSDTINYHLEKGNIMRILFDLLLKHSPAEITNIALHSQVFANRMGDRIYEFLEKRCERTQEESLCLALQLTRKRKPVAARELVEQFDGRGLLNVLIKNWPVLFETSLNHRSGNSIVVFSEFTEQCLLCSQRLVVQIVTANVLKYLLVNLQVLPFDVFLKLLIDYSALQIGCIGDGIGRKILLMTLELYLIDYFAQKRNKSMESSSIVSPMAENQSDISIKTTSNNNSIISDVDSGLSIFGQVAANKALKILVRSYLGQLKSYTLNRTQKSPSPVNPEMEPNSRMEFEKLEKDMENLFDLHRRVGDSQVETMRKLCGDDLSLSSSTKALLRPIVFFESRLNYLSLMPPLEVNFLDIILKPGQEFLKPVTAESREANLSCVKIQALLCSDEVLSEIFNEISQFVYANPSLVGIEGIITCVLPVRECIEFLTNVCPQAVLEYAKDRVSSEDDWKYLIQCLQAKSHGGGDAEAADSNGAIHLFYHRLLNETLEFLANTKPLEVVLRIFPEEEIHRSQVNNDATLTDRHHLNESELAQNPFIQNLRRCVEKERAHKIKMVITAKQAPRYLREAADTTAAAASSSLSPSPTMIGATN